MSRGLCILFGESFREGSAGSRLTDTTYGLTHQLEASASHMKLIRKIEDTGYAMDIAIHTYTTKYETELLNAYPNIVYANVTNKIDYPVYPPPENRIVQRAITDILSNVRLDDYSFVFVCRLDILLKDPFIHMFNPEATTITYPNVMSIEGGLHNTCIASLFVFIPSRYFNGNGEWIGFVKNCDCILLHHSVVHLLDRGLSLADIDFYTDSLYIANTIQESNPLYSIHTRPEGPVIHRSVRYDKSTHSIINIDQ